MKVAIDTHALVLWLIDPKKLGPKGRAFLRRETVEILVPIMAVLELRYLIEIGRIEMDISEALSFLATQLNVSLVPFGIEQLAEAMSLATRDPFDRAILATALAAKCALITRDRWMTREYSDCMW